jgi:hypothetical protein
MASKADAASHAGVEVAEKGDDAEPVRKFVWRVKPEDRKT